MVGGEGPRQDPRRRCRQTRATLMRARIVHHSEYLALALLLIGAAVWQKDQITLWFWFWLLAPDIFGYVPAFLFGRPPAKDHLPPRAVWLYNLCSTTPCRSRWGAAPGLPST